MKTFNIYFKNSRGKETLIDRVQDIGGTDTGAFSNSFKAIMGYIKKLNPEYKVFYTRWNSYDRYERKSHFNSRRTYKTSC